VVASNNDPRNTHIDRCSPPTHSLPHKPAVLSARSEGSSFSDAAAVASSSASTSSGVAGGDQPVSPFLLTLLADPREARRQGQQLAAALLERFHQAWGPGDGSVFAEALAAALCSSSGDEDGVASGVGGGGGGGVGVGDAYRLLRDKFNVWFMDQVAPVYKTVQLDDDAAFAGLVRRTAAAAGGGGAAAAPAAAGRGAGAAVHVPVYHVLRRLRDMAETRRELDLQKQWLARPDSNSAAATTGQQRTAAEAAVGRQRTAPVPDAGQPADAGRQPTAAELAQQQRAAEFKDRFRRLPKRVLVTADVLRASGGFERGQVDAVVALVRDAGCELTLARAILQQRYSQNGANNNAQGGYVLFVSVVFRCCWRCWCCLCCRWHWGRPPASFCAMFVC
jgi:hypothetical protein